MAGVDSELTDWVVLLEAADEQGQSTIDSDAFQRLVASWAVSAPTALHSPGRYALQATIQAADAPSALALAISRWKDALRDLALPQWALVRAEILTPAELESELQAAEWKDDPDPVFTRPTGPERLLADELLRRALHDGVTGLPNRETFIDDVRRALQAPLAEKAVRAVVAIALDPLKVGRGAPQPKPTSLLLNDIGIRLTTTVRHDDTVARIGEAEFAALVTLPSADHTEQLAERVVSSIRAVGERHGRRLTASVGVATATGGEDPDELLLVAELAMVAAREDGGDCYVHFAGRSEQDATG